MSRDLRRALDARAQPYPPTWRHEPGSVLVGRLVRYSQAPTRYGPAVVAWVEPDDGSSTVALWITPAVLLAEFKRLRPEPGEMIGARRLDDADNYQRWALEVDRPELDAPLAPLALPPHGGE